MWLYKTLHSMERDNMVARAQTEIWETWIRVVFVSYWITSLLFLNFILLFVKWEFVTFF